MIKPQAPATMHPTTEADFHAKSREIPGQHETRRDQGSEVVGR